jgi:xanthine permease
MNAQNRSKFFILGLQHVLAMYAGAVIVPLIVGGALKLDNAQMGCLIALDLLTCGIATLLQVCQTRHIGIGLPVVLGGSFTAVGPMISIGMDKGVAAIFGSILCSGIVVCLISGYFSKLKKFFPTVVTGSIVTIIGGALISVGINNLAGGIGSPNFGDLHNLALGFFVFVFIICINKYFSGFTREISILLGLFAGTVIGLFTGMVDFQPVLQAGWFNMMGLFYFGMPVFSISGIITMTIVAIFSMLNQQEFSWLWVKYVIVI